MAGLRAQNDDSVHGVHEKPIPGIARAPEADSVHAVQQRTIAGMVCGQ
jgi:hypothetical protein